MNRSGNFPIALSTCLLAILSCGINTCLAASTVTRAAIFSDRLPGQDQVFARELGELVTSAGYEVEFLDLNRLTNASELTAERFGLLVLGGARSLPADTAPAVEHYLRQGGDLLVLGLPAWDEPLFNVNGRWLSRAGFEQALSAQRADKVIFDFATEDLARWGRATDNREIRARHEAEAAAGGKALHVTMEKLTGWETFQSPLLTNAFAPGQTLTCFRARGTAHTKQLALEWTERDGSRWIATVDLSNEWKNFALPPQAFKAWQPPASRSGKNDGFNPLNAARFVVGLAHTHTAIEGVEQEYWLADLGTAANPFGDARFPDEFEPPHLESVSPGYQFFPVTPPAVLRAGDDLLARLHPVQENLMVKAPILGIHPRPRGVGFNQQRQYRWEPLLVVEAPNLREYRGAVAALLVHAQPPYRGGVWAGFTSTETEFYRSPTVLSCLADTLRRMRRGAFLVEAGSEFFTVFPKQEFKFGARVANFSHEAFTNLHLSIGFGSGMRSREPQPVLHPLPVSPGEIKLWEQAGVEFPAAIRSPTIETSLLLNNQEIDYLHHELGLRSPGTNGSFIEVQDGRFWLQNKPWKANGVNYMPSSGIGLANWQHFEHWLGRGAYDPEIIERDLERIKAMNMNAVSVFIYRESLEAQHLLDFLRRCDALDLKVNLSLRPGTPLDFRWNEMRELIEHYRLAENDTVFAYDLAWEPRHEAQDIQSRYAAAWSEWVRKRYADVATARKSWGVGIGDFTLEISDLKSVPAPPMKWFTQDGPWRRVIADYRLFLDALLHEKYAEARRLVRSIDPRHPVSFRMQHAGDATFNWDAFVPYDFHGLAGAVDIWEPEAYGRIGDWEKVKPGRFTADYARLCDPTKPLVWAEMGYTVWDNLHMAPAPEKLAFQAQYFRDFYRMMNDSAVEGMFFWWYPGGYRLNERSDYGILNPDGSDRPVTKVIREEGAKFLATRKPLNKPEHWIKVDRDRDSRGLFGIYESVKEEYWKAIAEGRTPRLKWEEKPRGARGDGP